MSDIILNLKESKIFSDDSFLIDKKINFIFGKNGTGKSTMASIIQSQIHNQDIRCFQGFDRIVGEDKKLNAVVLGEENNEINKEIKDIEECISSKEKQVIDIEKETLDSEANPNNLWKDVQKSKYFYDNQIKKIKGFCTKSASIIKNLNNPQISIPTYNISDFKKKINKAKPLTEDEIKKHINIINSDIKSAKKIDFQIVDLNDLLKETNFLLLKKVDEKELIPEISGNAKKNQICRGWA